MGKKEIIFGVGLMTLSVVVFALTARFPEQTMALPPAVYPRFVSTCLFIFSAILCVQGILGVQQKSAHQKKQTASKVDRRFLLRLAAMILLAFVYTRVLPLAGYVIATPLLVAGAMLLFNERRWGWIVGVSVGTSTILYVLFRIVFKVPLPRFNLW